jgi:RNA polymerase sigma-70 factor (ECF subfamily)
LLFHAGFFISAVSGLAVLMLCWLLVGTFGFILAAEQIEDFGGGFESQSIVAGINFSWVFVSFALVYLLVRSFVRRSKDGNEVVHQPKPLSDSAKLIAGALLVIVLDATTRPLPDVLVAAASTFALWMIIGMTSPLLMWRMGQWWNRVRRWSMSRPFRAGWVSLASVVAIPFLAIWLFGVVGTLTAMTFAAAGASLVSVEGPTHPGRSFLVAASTRQGPGLTEGTRQLLQGVAENIELRPSPLPLSEFVPNGFRSCIEEIAGTTSSRLQAEVRRLRARDVGVQDAEDIVFQALLNVCYSSESRRSPREYFGRAVQNARIDHYRQAQRCRVGLFPEPDRAIGPDQETRLLVQSLMCSLNDVERNVVTLHVLEGMSHAEIAVLLNRTAASVRQIYSRAIATMREALSH